MITNGRIDELKSIVVKKRTLVLNKKTGLSILILSGLFFGVILAGTILHPERISSQPEGYDLSTPLINSLKDIYSEQFEIKHTLSIDSSTVKTRQSYSTINDFGRSVTVDNEGNMILVGDTMSNLFPTLNAYDKTLNGTSDAFVAKFNALGDLLWSTFLGGKFGEEGWDVAIDSQNSVYVTGYTESFDFPGINAYDDYYNGGSRDVFVTKFDPDGNLVWSTFLGGNEGDEGYGIAIDGFDNVLVTGKTASSNFVTYNAYNNSLLGFSDSFITKLSVNGSLMWSTFVGTEATDVCNDIAIDSQNNVFITGNTIRRVSERVYAQSVCIFKFNSTGSSLWTLFLDGDEDEDGRSIAIDSQDNILITGVTKSSNFPTLNGSSINIQKTDIFVVKLQNLDGLLLWASFFGGNTDDVSSQILVDSTDNIIITGSTKSATFPIQNTDNNLGGAEDGFVTKFSSTTYSLLWSTFFGGNSIDQILGATIDSEDNIIFTGSTQSSDFPTIDAYDDFHGGLDKDSFLSSISSAGVLILSTYFGMSLENVETIPIPIETTPFGDLFENLINSGLLFQFILIVNFTLFFALATIVFVKRRKEFKRQGYVDQSIFSVLLFSISYGLRLLVKNKKKYVTLFISFAFVVAFAVSMFLWVEFSTEIAVQQAMDQTVYHLTLGSSEDTFVSMDQIYSWIIEQPWTEKVNRIRPVKGLLGIENKSADFYWIGMDPDNMIYLSTYSDSYTEINVVENSFLDQVSFHFSWQDDFQVNQTHCLVSQQFLEKMNDTLGWLLDVGDAFNLSLASNLLTSRQPKLRFWELHNLTLTINGVFQRIPTALSNRISFPAETLADGIFLANESLPTEYFQAITKKDSFKEKLIIKIDPVVLYQEGSLLVQHQIEIIKGKINNQFFGLNIEEHTRAVYDEIAKYQNTRVQILAIYTPLIVCSAYLVFFWTNLHSKTRIEELWLLKSRGGNLKQVLGLIGAEISLISIFGGILGILLGSFFTYLLVNKGQLVFDWDSIFPFLHKLWSFSFVWMIGLGLCIGLLMLVSLWRVYKLVQTEMETKREKESNWQKLISNHGLDLGIVMVALFVLILVIDTELIARFSRSQYYVLFLLCMLITWFGIGHLLARSVSRFAVFISRKVIRRLGSQILLIEKNFERKREATFVIAMLFIITFSISIFALVFVNSAETNALLISDYEVGSDFKIYTESQDLSFTKVIESDLGIKQCMPIQRTNAWFGTRSKVQIYGVNMSLYSRLRSWAPTSFLTGTPEENFERLANTENGIIINDLLASRFNKQINSTILLRVWLRSGHSQISYNVTGIIYSAPGLGVLKDLGNPYSFPADFGGVIVNGQEMEGEKYGYITSASLFLAQATDSSNIANKLETQARLFLSN